MARSWKKNSNLNEALSHAWRGIYEATKLKSKLWIAFGCAGVALFLGVVMNVSGVALGLIVLASAVVIAGEMFNTSLEALEDIVFPEYREAVRRSKDLAAGGVLVLSIGAAVVAMVIFLPPILAFLVY